MTTARRTHTTYWHLHPRNFVNECVIYRCETAAEGQEAEAAGYERLTMDQLRRHVRWVNGENEAWGSNRAFGAIVLRDVQERQEHAWTSKSDY